MSQQTPQKKVCRQGHSFYKSSDCPTCPVCEKLKPKVGAFADMVSPVRGALEAAGIKTLKQLARYSEREILALHGVGPSSLPLFKQKLKQAGLKFKDDDKILEPE